MLKYRSSVTITLGIILSAAFTFGQADIEPDAVSLLIAVSQRMNGIDQTYLVSLTQTGRNNSIRTQEFQFWIHYPEQADTILKQTLMLTTQPANDAGRKYWSWIMRDGRERTWICLPGTGSIREISDLRGILMQNFDIRELEIMPDEIDLYTHEILEHPLLDGLETILIKSSEQDGSAQGVLQRLQRAPAYKLLWIDPETLLIRKAEFYSPRDQLLKCITVEKTETHQGIELATSILVWDESEKTETVISVSDLSLDPITDPDLFQPKIE